MEETGDKKAEEDSDNNPKRNQAETDDSLSLSITPPILEDNKKDNENSDGSISEHLTSNSTSVENDRSYQEIEISNRPSNIFFGPPSSEEDKDHVDHMSQEKPRSLEHSFCSDNSIISLSFLDKNNISNMEVSGNVRSILEEILHNEQFQSGSAGSASLNDSKEESLDIFANVVLNDKSLTNFRNSDISLNEKNLFGSNFGLPLVRNDSDVDKRIKDFEEILAIKDTTIAALTSELDSFREMSNTNSGSMVSTTEYKQLQEECHNKLMEYNSAIIYKNDLIQQLSESLDQSVSERKELLKQVEFFKDEVAQLQLQLQETTRMVNEHTCSNQEAVTRDAQNVQLVEQDVREEKTEKSEPLINLDLEYSNLEENLNQAQKNLLNDLKIKINDFVKQNVMKNRSLYEEEINKLKERIVLEKDDYETEITRLRDLLANIKCGSTEIMELKNELEAKHSREMEELRTYFEKKCVDLEKNYSEEVFSQQSRKMSGSTCSEAELNSDILLSHSPGPDGDMRYELQPNITKKDLTNLKNELNSMLNKMNKYNLDNITEDDFSALKSEIGKCNLNNLLKYDLAIIKSDLQNKYYAELEVLRESNENKVDLLIVEHENRLKSLESKYLEEMENLKSQLDELEKQNVSISSAVQEVRLAANEAGDEEWPSELLQLRDRFTDRYENEIRQLKDEHQKEIEKLKEEHIKMLNGALERARRRSLKDGDSLSKGDLEILKQRDNLKKQVSSLRNLLGELLKYFTQCEDELNNTLVDELLKHGFDKNMTQIEDELNLNDSSATNSSKTGDSLANVTRVHMTPNFNDLINLIETNSQEDCESRDISLDLKNELGVCLEKLRQDANAILALTTSNPKQGSSITSGSPKNASLEEKLSSLTRQLINESQVKERLKGELNEALTYIETLEKEKEGLENNLDQIIAKENMLEQDLMQARNKIAELIENGHKETVSEGYGEEGHIEMHKMGDAMTILAELQDKARNMLAQSRASADPTLLHLIEELCRVGERIKEESQRERFDLLQQIEVADKKYRTTQKFLEEQAAERELERDEAQKRIDQLHDQLRERDRDRTNCERFTAEVNGVCCRDNRCKSVQVEQLEQQIQEMTRQAAEESRKCKEIETERNEAVDKIKVLREIIRELEIQTETKSKEIADCLQAIEKLECIVDQQHRSINELRQNDSLKDVSDIHELRRHINNLEIELQQTRVNSELAGSEGALKQIRTQLFEFEASLDKKTKELELLHSTETNCSSPSEDISARDLVRPTSPNMMDECEVPLQQLARLKEKLVRHSRAEDAAIKRIRDLEMQIFSLKNELEESNGEKDYMKKQVQEQLVLISDFQIRLDEQRIRAEHIEKQTNTSLELKIYDLQNDNVLLRDKLQSKNKLISHHQMLLSEAQERLKMLESEMSSTKEDELLVTMQKELEMLRTENTQLRTKISNEAQIVPNLVENIISDKNIDIEKLRDKLQETEKLLESYTSLNLDRRELQTLSNLKSDGTSIEEVLSILELTHVEQMRKASSRNDSIALGASDNLMYKRSPNESVFIGHTSNPEISSIEKVGPPNLHYYVQAPLTKPNSTEIHKSLEKRVHFEDTEDIERLRNEVVTLRKELESKETIVKEYEERLKLLNNLEDKIGRLQLSLEETEKALANATQTFEKEQQELRESEKNLGVELAEKKLQLSEKEKRIEILQQDSVRKNEMCMNLAREKRDLEQTLATLKMDSFKNLDKLIKEKNSEIDKLQFSLQSSHSNEELDSLKQELEDKNMEAISLQTQNEHLQNKLEKLKASHNSLEAKLKDVNEENTKLKKELQNNAVQIKSITTEMNNLKEKVIKKRRAIKELEDIISNQELSLAELGRQVQKQKDIITDRECEIEIGKEDAKNYQNNLALLDERIKELEGGEERQAADRLMEDVKAKETKIEELCKERLHLQELINEKDKIINQISEDSHKLHVNLVTIQTKLKETGNIIDLGSKLKEEQKRTADLLEEIHELKAQLMQYEMAKKNTEMSNSVDEITDQLKRELDYSAQIDSNIICAVSDQSLSSISESQDVEIYKKALAKEKSSRKQLAYRQEQLKNHVAQLEDKCASLQAFNSDLQSSLERERVTLRQTQAEDAKLIEQLRIQLDTVLDNEEVVSKLLSDEKVAREQLVQELEALKKKATNSSSASKTDSTEYKTLPSKEAIELNQLRKDFEALFEENNKLTNEVKQLKQAKDEVENDHKYTKDMLSLEHQKVESLENRVQDLMRSERELQESLLEKKVELEAKLRETNNNRIILNELEQEKTNLNQQKQELIQQLKMQTSNVPQTTQASPVSDVLLNKIKELNNALLDNKKLVDLIQRISIEKRNLESEIMELRGRKAGNVPFNDLVARSDYLFAKTLKLESTKKALIWQKRYLLDYLHGHQHHCMIEALPDAIPYRSEHRSSLSPRRRFKSAVIVVISILRMKFLVRRWHSGVRIAEKVNSRHYKHLHIKTESSAPTQFHVGQPVSSQLFSNNTGGAFKVMGSKNPFNLNQEDVQENAFGFYDDGRLSPASSRENAPWSGNTPPSKDSRNRNRIRIGPNILNREDMTPLKAPQLLAQFVERFDQIQDKLGVVLNTNTT